MRQRGCLQRSDARARGVQQRKIRDLHSHRRRQVRTPYRDLRQMPAVVSPGVLDMVQAPQVSTRAETSRMRGALPGLTSSHYAYGWRVYEYAGHTVVAHGGTVDGYGAQIMFLPDQDTGIVVLSNTRSKRFWRIAPMFLDLTLGLPPSDWMDLVPDGGARPGPR